ncbi:MULTISPECIES: hypothetical protein [Haloferax]|uniref:Uncharacterized protein n=2 Tax=Haloferax TaxID=2251 RepID=A0A6G1Z6Z1_9EURY|nr:MULTISPECIES: hypothetical protein [Haloferax]KAB1185161.1 hypothetical protein Hfx1149_16725 [Haloferax sp. CBA1149]MRW82339.1 hypothetical protein [Haloferax marinisediminis]
MYVEGIRTYDAPDGAALVRLQYTNSETVELSSGLAIGDSPRTFVTYYVDDPVVIRAEDECARSDTGTLDPTRG